MRSDLGFTIRPRGVEWVVIPLGADAEEHFAPSRDVAARLAAAMSARATSGASSMAEDHADA